MLAISYENIFFLDAVRKNCAKIISENIFVSNFFLILALKNYIGNLTYFIVMLLTRK